MIDNSGRPAPECGRAGHKPSLASFCIFDHAIKAFATLSTCAGDTPVSIDADEFLVGVVFDMIIAG